MSILATASGVEKTSGTAARQRRLNRADWWIAYFAVCGIGLSIAALGFKRSGQLYLGIAFGVWTALLAAWVRFPRSALGITIALALVADLVTVSWFPFLKNFSSLESITYISDAISVTPFEITLIWALTVTAYKNFSTIGRPFRSAPLIRPLAFFMLLVVGGLVVGLSRGGDNRIAIFEARPLLYLPLLYLLVVNVCHTMADYRRMFWMAAAGVFVQSWISIRFLQQLPASIKENLESLNEHGSSIGMNLVFAMTIMALVFKGVSWKVRLGLLVASAPVLWVYLVAQRRAAVVSLVVGLIVLAIILFWRQRRTFWKVVPISTIILAAYVGAFWNSESTAGFPAQAVKTVVAPNSLSAKDQSSDEYRKIEGFNLWYTIRASPITGQGFGQPFLRPVALPDISSYEFNAYLPHNSLLWIWIKTGFLGFVTLLYLLARTLSLGGQRVRHARPGIDLLIASSATMFVVMYSVYVFVDIAWEARNVTLLALAMATCTALLDSEHSPNRARRSPAGTGDTVNRLPSLSVVHAVHEP